MRSAALPTAFDELGDLDGAVRAQYTAVATWLRATPAGELDSKRREAEALFRRIGITFAVYAEGGDPERLIPFDMVPRVLDHTEWALLERGLKQRVSALNAFLHDIYHDQAILRAGKMDRAQIEQNPMFQRAMVGVDLPEQIYSHIAGIDLVRTGPNDFYVLEDNCRTPSGVSYMLENREVMMRLFPHLFEQQRIAPIAHYPEDLLDTLRSVAPRYCPDDPHVALLTPGVYNSAYYEHSFLADEMGIPLVEGQDLLVEDNVCYMRTTRGRQRIDVLYRRIDDDFLDPEVFRADSALGASGLMRAVRAGTLTLTNAPGAGIADDKAIYPYVPEMIRFYCGEEPILNTVPTYRCGQPDELAYVLDHIADLVVKEAQGSGGYGMIVGPMATRAELDAFKQKLRATPNAYVAQPTLALSTVPTFVEQGLAPRHVDLRPFVLSGKEIRVTPGGLTRVALQRGSLVVNSSQGGGTKDTWVLEAPALQG